MAHAEFGLRRFRAVVDALAVIGALDFARERLDGIGPQEPDVLQGILGDMDDVRNRGIEIEACRLVEHAVYTERGTADHVAANDALRGRKFRFREFVDRMVLDPEVDKAMYKESKEDEQDQDGRLP